MEAPPPRYRIVERGRRLVVTDTWAGRDAPRVAAAPVNRAAPTPSSPPQPSTAGAGDPFIATIARLACRNTGDADGRPILLTNSTFDDKAPRAFVLGEQGQRRLALSVLGAAFALLAIAGMFSDTLFTAVLAPVAVAAGIVFKGRALITWWLDGFAGLDGR